MIGRIDRAEALRRIRREGGDYACLMCALRDGRFGPLTVLHQDPLALVTLPRYVTRWGHVLVLLRSHVTQLSAVSPGDWLHLCALAHRAARAAEQVLRTRRCFVASTGSSGGELTQSSEHLHLHVLDVGEGFDRQVVQRMPADEGEAPRQEQHQRALRQDRVDQSSQHGRRLPRSAAARLPSRCARAAAGPCR